VSRGVEVIGGFQKGLNMLRWVFVENRVLILRRKGREAVTVYNIKYLPACRRSG
jgi:hypothetical protein